MKAFPSDKFEYSPAGNKFHTGEKGMDLRDYFAAKAMQGLIEDGHDCKWLTHRAYEYADAMMEARNK